MNGEIFDLPLEKIDLSQTNIREVDLEYLCKFHDREDDCLLAPNMVEIKI